MSAPDESPSPPASDAEYSDCWSSPKDSNPPYTPEELAEIFLDFYKFLTMLHFDPADLRIAPPEGWPSITREAFPDWKTDLVIEVLRRLPYFNASTNTATIHYKSVLEDYSSMDRKDVSELEYAEEGLEFWDNEGIVDPIHVVGIATGYGSYGRSVFLDVKHGLITEDMVRADQLDHEDVKDWLRKLKEAYRSLKLIPSKDRDTIWADDVPERAAGLGQISEEEVHAQTKCWGTLLDIQYLRQLYRQYGWPDAFRRQDADKAVDELLDSVKEQRGNWY